MSPRTRRLLLALYPARWRRQHAEAFDALLEDTPTSAAALLDVAGAAGREHLAARPVALRVLAAGAAFAVLDATAAHLDVTDNILWAPTDPQRALVLAATLTPPAWLVHHLVARRAHRRPEQA